MSLGVGVRVGGRGDGGGGERAGEEADFFNEFLGEGREVVVPDWWGDGVEGMVVCEDGVGEGGWRGGRRGRVVGIVVAASLVHVGVGVEA